MMHLSNLLKGDTTYEIVVDPLTGKQTIKMITKQVVGKETIDDIMRLAGLLSDIHLIRDKLNFY